MNLLKAILLKVASALLFSVMQALVRSLGDAVPLGEVVFFRSAFAIVPVVLVYAWRDELAGAIRTSRPFGQLWRGEIVGIENARQRLGWATAPESQYDAAYQCAVTSGRLWNCYLRDSRGQVLLLGPDSTVGVNFVWSVVPSK